MNDLITQAWNCVCDEVSDKLVLIYLSDRANMSGKAWPHFPKIMKHTGLAKPTVSAALKRLKARGHITFESKRGRANSYIVHPKHIETGSTTEPVKDVQPLNRTGSTIALEVVQPLNQHPNHHGISMKRLNVANSGIVHAPRITTLITHRSKTASSRDRERELMARLRTLLGENEMKCAGGMWRTYWVRPYPALVESVLNDLDLQIKEGKQIHSRAAWTVDQLKRLKK